MAGLERCRDPDHPVRSVGGRQGLALAQLPAATAGFTGRDDELKVFAGLLDPAGTSGPVVVSAVAGLAGVGKATLAVEAGHAAQRAAAGCFCGLAWV